MRRKEINERSPVRVLEASIHGGLGPGNIGVVVARHGVGKTAFLVGVALDDLMRGRKVLHVSLEHPSEKVRTYYDEIFSDLAHEKELEDVWKVRLEMERNRRIHAYIDGSFSIDKLREAIAFMREHSDFSPVAIMLDGYPFDNTKPHEDGCAAPDRPRQRRGDVDGCHHASRVGHQRQRDPGTGCPPRAEDRRHLANGPTTPRRCTWTFSRIATARRSRTSSWRWIRRRCCSRRKARQLLAPPFGRPELCSASRTHRSMSRYLCPRPSRYLD